MAKGEKLTGLWIMAGLVSVLVLLVLFVFNTDLKTNTQAATLGWNIVGGALVTLSVVPLVIGARPREMDATPFAIAWAAMLVLGIFCALGWFEYTY